MSEVPRLQRTLNVCRHLRFDHLQEGRCKATWKREFKLSWREAGPPNHHDDKVDSDPLPQRAPHVRRDLRGNNLSDTTSLSGPSALGFCAAGVPRSKENAPPHRTTT